MSSMDLLHSYMLNLAIKQSQHAALPLKSRKHEATEILLGAVLLAAAAVSAVQQASGHSCSASLKPSHVCNHDVLHILHPSD